MSEATLILKNMRGGCATVGNKVHTLFRFNGRLPRDTSRPAQPGTEGAPQLDAENSRN